jgi:hypothetical protein
MTLTLPHDLETQLRRQAAKEGIEIDAFVRQSVEARLKAARDAELLGQVRLGISDTAWKRLRVFREKLLDETLTPAEREELIDLNTQLENANARRIGVLVELSKLRGVPLPDLMKTLGIFPGSEDPTHTPEDE